VDFDGSKVSSNVITIEPKVYGKGLKVYPNPLSNVLTVEFNNGLNKATNFEVVNILGQIVLRGTVNQSVDVLALSNGTYIVKVGEEQVKFVKN
jgi:Secretion system C-terminal sorting domain